MRDDVRQSIHHLHSLLNQKLSLLNHFLNRETNKLSRINSGRIDELESLLLLDQQTIEAINGIDFEIGKIEHELTLITGHTSEQLETLFASSPESIVTSLIETRQSIHDTFSLLSAEREKTITLLEKQAGMMQRDFEELRNLIALKEKG